MKFPNNPNSGFREIEFKEECEWGNCSGKRVIRDCSYPIPYRYIPCEHILAEREVKLEVEES